MAWPSIKNLWAQTATNRQIFSDEEVKKGITYQGPVVSNQLNGIAYDLYSYVDQLQRGGAFWSPFKLYNEGDIVRVPVSFNGQAYVLDLKCRKASIQSDPLIKKDSDTSFTKNTEDTIASFSIQTSEAAESISSWVNSTDWQELKGSDSIQLLNLIDSRLRQMEEKIAQNKIEIEEKIKASNDRVLILENTPSSAILPLSHIANMLIQKKSFTLSAGSQYSFTASYKRDAKSRDCILITVYISTTTVVPALSGSTILFDFLDYSTQSEADPVRVLASDFKDANHIYGVYYPLRSLNLNEMIFGPNASFHYSVGQLVGTLE